MARYGHKDWLIWRDRTGARHTERLTPETLKQCLLDSGTQGHWSIMYANDCSMVIGYWWLGINILNQMKRGIR